MQKYEVEEEADELKSNENFIEFDVQIFHTN